LNLTFIAFNRAEALRRLAARQERDCRYRGGDGPQEACHCRVGHFVHRFLLGAAQPREHHVGLHDHALERHALCVQLTEDRPQDLLGHLTAATQRMRAVHEHFRLDDGDHAGFLAERRITGQRVRVGRDAPTARKAVAQDNHRAPLGESGTHSRILDEAFAQPIQALGDSFARVTCQGLRPGIDFDARHEARPRDGFDERSPVSRVLTERLVVENYAADAIREPGRGDDPLAVRTPRLLGLRNLQLCKSLVAGGIALVHRQQAPVAGDESPGQLHEVGRVHRALPHIQFRISGRSCPCLSM